MTDDTSREASRPFVRIYRSIVRDQDFADLDPDAKVIYLRLLFDPDNNMAGLFTLTVNRWAKWANISVEQAWEALRVLDAARFVVLDEDEQELLVRTKLRNDTLQGGSSWKTQKGALTTGLKAISPRIRTVLADEVEKCRHLFRESVLEYVDEVVRELRGDAGMDAGMDAGIEHTYRPTDQQTADLQTADLQTADLQTADASHVASGWPDERPPKQFTRRSKGAP